MNQDALQTQFTTERQNAADYRAIADALEAINWPGSASWMRKASDEEQDHADKFAGYLIDRNVTPRYDPLAAPGLSIPDDDMALTSAFRAAYSIEQRNTAKILDLYAEAFTAGDYQTTEFLGWAIAEQTGAEGAIMDILTELARADCSAARLILDAKYGG